MKRTFSLWSSLLFLSKETDSDSTKPGGINTANILFGGDCAFLGNPHFIEDVAT